MRTDALFKLAVGQAPESGRDLCSQPTISRLENAPSLSGLERLTAGLVDIFCGSFPIPPAAITLDIDNTCDAVHAHLVEAAEKVGAIIAAATASQRLRPVTHRQRRRSAPGRGAH